MFPTGRMQLCLLLSLLVLAHVPTACMQTKFYVKTVRLIGDNIRKFTAHVKDEDPKITRIRYFVTYCM